MNAKTIRENNTSSESREALLWGVIVVVVIAIICATGIYITQQNNIKGRLEYTKCVDNGGTFVGTEGGPVCLAKGVTMEGL